MVNAALARHSAKSVKKLIPVHVTSAARHSVWIANSSVCVINAVFLSVRIAKAFGIVMSATTISAKNDIVNLSTAVMNATDSSARIANLSASVRNA